MRRRAVRWRLRQEKAARAWQFDGRSWVRNQSIIHKQRRPGSCYGRNRNVKLVEFRPWLRQPKERVKVTASGVNEGETTMGIHHHHHHDYRDLDLDLDSTSLDRCTTCRKLVLPSAARLLRKLQCFLSLLRVHQPRLSIRALWPPWNSLPLSKMSSSRASRPLHVGGHLCQNFLA